MRDGDYMPGGVVSRRIVLAYSGGLSTTVAIRWLKEHHHADVIAVTMDLGQEDPLAEVRDRALASGAVRAHVLDLRDEFARRFVVPALQADALDDDGSPSPSLALGAPLIAERLVEMAVIEKAAAIAHGCARRREPAPLEVALADLEPPVEIKAVAQSFAMSHRQQLTFARARGLRLPAAIDRSFRVRSNLWARSVEWGPSDHGAALPSSAYRITRSPADCPDEPAVVDLAFDQGVPTSINGVTMSFLELVASLGALAGTHGVGRIGPRARTGRRPRVWEAVEAPAALTLYRAHHELQRRIAPRLETFGRTVGCEYAGIIAEGRWFSPDRAALDAYIEHVQRLVTGVVRLTLFKGDIGVVWPVGDKVWTTPPAPVSLVTEGP